MGSVLKKARRDRGSADPARVMQGRFPKDSARGNFAAHLAGSPMMAAQRRKLHSLFGGAAQLEEASASRSNKTGLPDNLKAGVENLSGMPMDHVRVHYNSSKPAQLNALACTQGGDIHVAPGQEKHLPHEAWHVVQQAQGRVEPTMLMAGGLAIKGERSARMHQAMFASSVMQAYANESANDSGVLQLMRVVDAVHKDARVVKSSDRKWMINQGLQGIGSDWHLTIFPENQDKWVAEYRLPAKGSRPIQDWMTFGEFHISTPGSGKHFFYTDQLVPLSGSLAVNGSSQPWTDTDWGVSNSLVTWWFRQGSNEVYDWLNQYVGWMPEMERQQNEEQRQREKHEKRLWEEYKQSRKENPQLHTDAEGDYAEWKRRVGK